MRAKTLFKLPPGVSKNASPSMDKARWHYTNLIRWVNGRLQPLGGYVDSGLVGFGSPIRRLFTWTDNSAVVRTAVLCEKHLYVIVAGVLYDITPAGGITGPVNGSPLGGYGDDAYGAGIYGTARTAQPGRVVAGNCYTLSNYGEQLLAMSSADGRLLMWDPNTGTGTPSKAVQGAPQAGRTFVVTPERYVIMFSYGGDARKFGWCDQENINDWDVTSVTNTAGEFEVEPSAPTSCAIVTKQGTLFFTGVAAYLITYQGPPYVYAYNIVGTECTPISSQSVVRFGGTVVWMAENGMWVFDGGTVQPLTCELWDWFKRKVNKDTAKDTLFAVNLGKYPELYWFFPSMAGGQPDTYVMWNYVDNWWAHGRLSRQAGVPSRYSNEPTLASATKVYYHEKGTSYADGDIAYAVTANIALGAGQVSTFSQMVPDNSSPDGVPLFSVYGRNTRTGSKDTSTAEEVAENMSSIGGYVDVLMTARDFQLKVSSPDPASNAWDFGEAMLDVRPRGSR